MTPVQKIKALLLYEISDKHRKKITKNNVDDLFEKYMDDLWDIIYEWASGEFETDIKPEYDRHYESRSVGAEMIDGSLVGWTYYYGGGKWGDPGSIRWWEDAYNLELVSEHQEIKTIRNYKKVD